MLSTRLSQGCGNIVINFDNLFGITCMQYATVLQGKQLGLADLHMHVLLMIHVFRTAWACCVHDVAQCIYNVRILYCYNIHVGNYLHVQIFKRR